jgi:hypothetical protein
MHNHLTFFTSRFLFPKLVAREAENDEALIFVLLIKFFESCILLGESTLGRYIHNQDHLYWNAKDVAIQVFLLLLLTFP